MSGSDHFHRDLHELSNLYLGIMMVNVMRYLLQNNYQLQDSTTGAIYNIVSDTSIRGKDQLFDGVGYSYTVKRRTIWRCTLRSKTVNCAATVRQTGDNIVCGLRQHIRQPSLGTVHRLHMDREYNRATNMVECVFPVGAHEQRPGRMAHSAECQGLCGHEPLPVGGIVVR